MSCQRWTGTRLRLLAALPSLTLCLGLCAAVPVQAFDGTAPAQILPTQGTLEAAFAPWDDIEARLLDALVGARHQILVQAYILTSKPLTQALIAAHQRGVDVRVLLDAGQLSHTGKERLAMLQAVGISVRLETAYKNAHNKVIIIDAGTDDATLITGSYNFSWSAQNKNAENILIARKNAPLAARYAANWMRHFKDAELPDAAK